MWANPTLSADILCYPLISISAYMLIKKYVTGDQNAYVLSSY